MSGWMVQGVRGEGKSLYAVHRVQEYLNRGCMVATNLDLFLDELVDDENASVAYRLPDKPRIEDFESLPDAYDIKYKGEDKNGLIVLDELALWFNARTWKDKGRQEIINWLLLSRKRHWDLILLVQDHDMVDKQVKTTLCDYLVQASRTDREKIPYLSKILDLFYIHSYKPKIHVYDIYYGFSGLDTPTETVRVTGRYVYDGYDTNQLFGDGTELLGTKIVDMRAVYTYLPACYLSGQYYIKKHEKIISDQEKEIQAILKKGASIMAKRRNATAGNGLTKIKMILLVTVLVGWVVWNFFLNSPDEAVEINRQPPTSSSTSSRSPSPEPPQPQQSSSIVSNFFPSGKTDSSNNSQESVLDNKELPQKKSNSLVSFLDRLVNDYRPRLSGLASSPDTIAGTVEFWDEDVVVERFSIVELHGLGFAVVKKAYGVNLVTATGVYPVTSWPKPLQQAAQEIYLEE